jgi:hypothetical protein
MMHMINMKGRHTVRAHTPGGREPRFIEPWVLESKENTSLHKLRTLPAVFPS